MSSVKRALLNTFKFIIVYIYACLCVCVRILTLLPLDARLMDSVLDSAAYNIHNHNASARDSVSLGILMARDAYYKPPE